MEMQEHPDVSRILRWGYPWREEAEEVPEGFCVSCREPILPGETYYQIEGFPYCEACMDECRRIAGWEEEGM